MIEMPEASASARPRRSLLFTPASNRRALQKTRVLEADGFIFDLEDAVAPESKAQARRNLAEFFSSGRPARDCIVRVNAIDSEMGRADLALICPLAPDAILIPKIARVEDIAAAERLLRDNAAPASLRLWIMIETPRAILDVGALARAAAGPGARLSAFVLGLNDLAFETRARQTPDRAPMTAWMSAAVAAARAFGLEVFDGVSNRLNDPEGFRRECAQGRDFGMDGKTLIHPDQIAICNEVFAPTFEEVEDARAVLAAFAAPEAIGRGALRVGGRMVERLHAEAAERTLRIAAVIDRRRG